MSVTGEPDGLPQKVGATIIDVASTQVAAQAVLAALFRRVRDSPTLRRVCDLAGRYRLLAQSRQRRKAAHGLDDLVGVTLGGDVGRLLPAELARLALPECEDDLLRRLAEGQAQCREHRAIQNPRIRLTRAVRGKAGWRWISSTPASGSPISRDV